MKKLIMLTLGIGLMAMSVAKADCTIGQFKWNITGHAAAYYDVGLQLHNQPATRGVKISPGGGCNVVWNFNFSEASYGGSCNGWLQTQYDLVVAPHSGGPWVIWTTFSMDQVFGLECCHQNSPCNCSGSFDVGTYYGICGSPTITVP